MADFRKAQRERRVSVSKTAWRLARLRQDPAVASLVAKLERAGDDQREFLQAYFRSQAPYGRRSLLLRLALGDTRCGATTHLTQPRLTPALLRNIVTFLELHPRAPLDPFTSRYGRDVPAHLRALFGNPNMGIVEFVRRTVLLPYVRVMTGQPPYPGMASEVSPSQARQILAPAAGRVLLTPDDAKRFLSARSAKSTRRTASFFFDTGLLALDVRNILQFTAVLFAQSGHGGRLQSRLPTGLRARVGTRRGERHISIPELLLASDLLAFAILGLLHESKGYSRNPLAQTIDALTRDRPPVFLKDLKTLARHHFQRALLDPSSSATLCGAQDRGRWEQMYGSGLLFNLERLVGEDAAKRRFAEFIPLYSLVDETALRRAILRHFRRVEPVFGDALKDLMRFEPAEFAGIKGRSLANALFHARYLAAHDEKPGVRLPTVAKWRLGLVASEQTNARSGKRRRPQRHRHPYSSRPILTLPLLEKLAARVPILEI